VASRAWARELSPDREADLMKNLFQSQGMIGGGRFEKDDPTALIDSYRFKADFNVHRFIKPAGSGAFFIHPLLGASVGDFLNYSMEPETVADVTCTSGSLTEEYEIELPAAMKVLSVPDEVKVSSDVVDYRATYELSGRTLKVRREIDDRTVGNVCGPQAGQRYREFGEKVVEDLKSQVLYKWKAD
jgi:hypothetical protein